MCKHFFAGYPGTKKNQAFFIFCLFALGTLQAQPKNPREIIPLDTGWQFWLGDDPAARQPGFNDAGWRTLTLPHDWTIESPVNPPPTGERNGGIFRTALAGIEKALPFPTPPKNSSLSLTAST